MQKPNTTQLVIGIGLGLAILVALCKYTLAHPEHVIMAAIGIGAIARAWWVHGVGPWSRAGRRFPPCRPQPSCSAVPVAAAPQRQGNEPAPLSPEERRVADQLSCIGRAPRLAPRRILNPGEAKIFYGALSALASLGRDCERWHVHAQPSLGELIEVKCPKCTPLPYHQLRRCDPCFEAFKAINGKRPDLVICDNFGMPVLIIEHQGDGHIDRLSEQRERISRLRNEIKETAYFMADLRCLETPDGTSADEACALITQQLHLILLERQSLQ